MCYNVKTEYSVFTFPFSPFRFQLYNEFPYLAVVEQGDIPVGNALDFGFHNAAEESVAEGEDFLSRVFATHLIEELVCTFLHRFLGLHSLVEHCSFYWCAGKVAKVAEAP